VEELDALGATAGGTEGFVDDADDLPNWLMTMSSLVSLTKLMLETLPTLG
jgi:hypothetical protein